MAFNTKRTLDDTKYIQSAGKTLTLSGDTNIAYGEYLTDKSSTYTARSLVDAEYVTGQTVGKLDCTDFNTYTGDTDTRITNIETDVTTISGDVIQNAADIQLVSGVTTINSGNITTISAQTDINTSDISNLGALSGITEVSITGVTNGLTKVGAHDAKLGGTLTADTTINTNNLYGISLGIGSATGNNSISLGSGSVGSDGSIVGNGGYAGADNSFVIGTNSQSIATATNAIAMGNCAIAYGSSSAILGGLGLKTCGNYSIALGGNGGSVDGDYSAKIGGRNTTLGASNRAVILGGYNINVDTGYTDNAIVDNLAIWTAPTQGVFNDGVLVWDSVDKKVKQVASSVIGGITGASNGLNVVDKEVLLGGALTEATNIDLTNFDLTIDGTSILYGGDYSSTYVARSLVDAAYVTGLTSQAILTANNGLTKDGTNVRLGGSLTGITTVDTNLFGIVLGNSGTITGADSVILVNGSVSGNCAVAMSNGIAGGDKSIAFSDGETVGSGSFAFGTGSVAYANNSAAFGGTAKSCGVGSFAFGTNVTSIGLNSVSFGGNAESFGSHSFAFGNYVIADGNNSFAFGSGVVTKEVSASGASSINFSTNTSAQEAGHGADADYSTILGGINHHIRDGNIGAAIIGRCGTTGIELTGTSYVDTVAVSNLALWQTPADDSNGDVLVWDSVSKKVGKTTIASLGGLTGATNGLKTYGQDAGLGGILTEASTVISGDSKNYSLGSIASPMNLYTQNANCHIVSADACAYFRTEGASGSLVVDAQNDGGVVIKSQCGTVVSSSIATGALGFDLNFTSNIFKVIDNRTGVDQSGIAYQSDYSANYLDRSLVDKAYVDSVAAGLDAKDAVNVATTDSDGNIDLTGGTFVSGTTLDGVIVDDGWRVLVKNQTDAIENGIWLYSASTSAFTRTDDFDGNPTGEVSNGAYTLVITGDTLINTQWVVTSPDPIDVDVDDINWSLLSQQIGIQAGTGITITTLNSNNTISTKLAVVSSMSYDAGLGLRVDSSIAGSGLTMTAGVLAVNADPTGIVGNEIPIHFGTNNCLYVDDSDFSYTTAANGLTKVDTNVTLGGDLTGTTEINGVDIHNFNLCNLNSFNLTYDSVSIITDTGANGGIHYATDYSGDYVARSLVDAAYVTGLTSNLDINKVDCTEYNTYTGNTRTELDLTLTGATNGLTKVGREVKLGGTLTGDTCVNTATFGIAMGVGSVATGANSFAFGNSTTASGDSSHAEGSGSIAGGIYSHAEGYSTTASGTYSHAEGYSTTANGPYSHAEGDKAIASGSGSHAEGKISTASGSGSHAEGGSTIAFGNYSHAGGYCTTASGNYSHAGGRGYSTKETISLGVVSFNHSTNDVLQTVGHGALAPQSAILGGINHNIESGNTGAAIIGGDAIKLTGTDYIDTTAVDNLAIFTAPTQGVFNDGVLVWDSADKIVKQVASSVIGGITGASNGLNVVNKEVLLGGILTEETNIDLTNFGLTVSGTSILYGGDYSSTYVARSLVDAAYVTGLTSANETTANNGLTKDGTNIRLGGTLTGDTIVDTNSFGIAMGVGSVATGANSFAFGSNASATGTTSFAEGNNTLASNFYSHAEGEGTIACGVASHAEGNITIASGYYSHTEGQGTTASNNSSHAEGKGTTASGVASHSEGCTTIAGGDSSHVGGYGIIGKEILGGGSSSFNHSTNNISQTIGHGALAPRSAILGGQNHNIEVGNTGAAIIGGDAIKLTGTDYIDTTAVDNLAIWTAPSSGIITDPIMVWDSADKKIKQVDGTLFGTVTGASNGLNVSAKEVIMGGALTQDTSINGASGVYDLTFTAIDNFTTSADTVDIISPSASNSGYLGITGTTVVLGVVDTSQDYKIDITNGVGTITDVIGAKGINYALCYHSNYSDRTLVDKEYVDNAAGAILANNGLTRNGDIISLGGALTGDTAITFGGNGLVIGSGTSIAGAVVVDNLAISVAPTTGDAVNDAILVWDSADKKVKQVDPSALGEDNNIYNYISGTTTINLSADTSTYVVLVDTTSASAIVNLPATPDDGQAFKIKDKAGCALPNNITIDAGSGEFIDDARCASINTDFGALEIMYSAQDDKWFTLAFVN